MHSVVYWYQVDRMTVSASQTKHTVNDMKKGIIIQQDGFRGDTVAVGRYKNDGVIIGTNSDLYRLEPTGERTKPENYVVCDVYNTNPFPGDDGRALWQIALSEEHLAHLTHQAA